MTELYERDAELYDLAFRWDVEDEVDWLVGRLGPECRSVLEPGCGSGRVLATLARRGLEVVGLDRSPAMVELARARLGGAAEVALADMTDFDLGRTFDGALCPINTLAHLSPAELGRHLERMGRHLRPGARYLVQLQLGAEPHTSEWETEQLRVTWATESVDVAAGRQRHRSRIEILAGERAGEVVEELHDLTLWTRDAWAAAVAASPFTATAVFDGAQEGYPAVATDAEGRMLWHELTRSGQQRLRPRGAAGYRVFTLDPRTERSLERALLAARGARLVYRAPGLDVLVQPPAIRISFVTLSD